MTSRVCLKLTGLPVLSYSVNSLYRISVGVAATGVKDVKF